MPSFVEVRASTDDELHALLQTVIARLMKMLTLRGVLIEEMGQTGSESTHCRTGMCRITWSTKWAAVWDIPRSPPKGQNRDACS
jgi:hypothetical protein